MKTVAGYAGTLLLLAIGSVLAFLALDLTGFWNSTIAKRGMNSNG